MAKLNNQYLYLPKQFWSDHERCVKLIGQIEEFVTDDKYQKLKFYPILFENEKDLPHDDENILDFLLRTGRNTEHDQIVINNIVYALVMDTCYFLQEALSCSLKMRLPVTFALLRKPLVYNLIVFLRIIYENDFIHKFNNIESFDSAYMTNDYKKELIKISTQNSKTIKEENVDLIFDIIFNKNNAESIINMSERALHLSTTKNDNNKTGKKNLNFIFSTFSNNVSMWEYLYSKLPFIFFYLIDVLDSLVLPIVDLSDKQKEDRLLKRTKIFKNKIRCTT
jgi:hypothetical protein